MKTHAEFEALLDAFVDGELSSGDSEAVKIHLTTCPECRAYVEDALAIRADFPTIEDTDVPDDFAENILSAIAVPAKKRPWKKLLLPLAACLAIIVAVKTALPTSETPTEPEARTVAEPAMTDFSLVTAYFARLTLTAEEADDLLSRYSPIEETGTSRS